MKDAQGRIIPDKLGPNDERVELRDESGKLIGIADIGMGHPDDPTRNELLSVEDERRIDDRGNTVVEKKPWGDVPTGLYLAVLCAPCPVVADRKVRGGTSMPVPRSVTSGADLRLFVGSYLGKPAFGHEYAGACLEVPSDLALDSTKRKYVTEWVAHTAVESLGHYGIVLTDHPDHAGVVAQELAWAAQDALQRSGL